MKNRTLRQFNAMWIFMLSLEVGLFFFPNSAQSVQQSFKNLSQSELIQTHLHSKTLTEQISQDYKKLKAKRSVLEMDIQRLQRENQKLRNDPSLFVLEDREIQKNRVAIAQKKKVVVGLNQRLNRKGFEYKNQKIVTNALRAEIAYRSKPRPKPVVRTVALVGSKMVAGKKDTLGVAPIATVKPSRSLKEMYFLAGGLMLIGLFIYSLGKIPWNRWRLIRKGNSSTPEIKMPPDLAKEIAALDLPAKDRVQYI